MPEREPVSDGSSEVHHVDGELADSELAEQRVYYIGKVVEGVVERGPVRYRAVAEGGVVRSDDVVRV